MCPKLYRLMSRALAQQPVISLTTSPVQVFGLDICRLRVTVASYSTRDIQVAFSIQTTTLPNFTNQINANVLILRVEDIGSDITLPIWIWTAGTGASLRPIRVISAIPQDLQEFAGNGFTP